MRFPLWVAPTNILSSNEEMFIAPEGVMAWSTSKVNGRYPVPPGGGILRKLQVFTPLGAGSGSWTFSYVVNGVEVESTRAKLEGEEVKSVVWNGELKLKEGDTFEIRVAGAGSPTILNTGINGVALYSWVETTGNIFWVAGGGGGNLSTSVSSYNPVFGINSAGWGTTEGATRVVIPGEFTLKGVALDLSGTAGASKSYKLFARRNRTEDALEAKIEGTSATSALAEGSVSLKAGEVLEAKVIPTGTPSARTARYTYAVESQVAGEMFALGVNVGADSTTAKQATYPDSWKSTWANEANAEIPRPTGLKFERLYAEVSVAPGILKSRQYSLTLGAAAQALAVKIEGEATTGNNVVNSFTTDGTKVSLRAEPSALAPAANTGGTHWGFIVIVPQPVELEGAQVGAGSTTTDLHGLFSLGAAPIGVGSITTAAGSVANILAQVQGQGSAAGLLQLFADLASAPTGTSAVAAGLGPVTSFDIPLAGVGAFNVEFRALYELVAAPNGSGALSGEFRALADLAAKTVGNAQLSAELEELASIIAALEAELSAAGGASTELEALARFTTVNLEALGVLGAAFARRYMVPGNAALSDSEVGAAAVRDAGVWSVVTDDSPVSSVEE